MVGGRDQPTAVKCFNVLTMTWSQLPDMPEGRRSAGAYDIRGFSRIRTCLNSLRRIEIYMQLGFINTGF